MEVVSKDVVPERLGGGAVQMEMS